MRAEIEIVEYPVGATLVDWAAIGVITREVFGACRLKGSVLQQHVAIETRDGRGRPVSYRAEWRDVPKVEGSTDDC